jgi:hypothetical protein
MLYYSYSGLGCLIYSLSSPILSNIVPYFACCVYCSSCGFIGWPTELWLSLLLIVITPWYTGTDRYQWSEDGHYTLLLGDGIDGMLAPFSLLLMNSDSLSLLVQSEVRCRSCSTLCWWSDLGWFIHFWFTGSVLHVFADLISYNIVE